jgi:isopenicillin N synthase-like dioxygenase
MLLLIIQAAPLRTQLLQASNHAGLQVQNLSGAWIDVPPLPNTFVINIGKGMLSFSSGDRCSFFSL